MAHQQFPAPSRKEGASASRILPRIELREIGPSGMIIRAGDSMQPGMTLALGVHLTGVSQRRRFMDFEGIVVDCRRLNEGEDALLWEVTLLFPHLTASQARALRSAARSLVQAAPVTPPAPPSGSGFHYGEREFSAWCGVN